MQPPAASGTAFAHAALGGRCHGTGPPLTRPLRLACFRVVPFKVAVTSVRGSDRVHTAATRVCAARVQMFFGQKRRMRRQQQEAGCELVRERKFPLQTVRCRLLPCVGVWVFGCEIECQRTTEQSRLTPALVKCTSLHNFGACDTVFVRGHSVLCPVLVVLGLS